MYNLYIFFVAEEHKYCKHTVAVELYLREQHLSRIISSQTPVIKKADNSMAEMFNQGFNRLSQGVENPVKPLQIEFVIEPLATNPYHAELDVLGISLKIGETAGHRYVVKNIYDFLTSYQNNKSFSVNKQTQLQLAPEAFKDPELLTDLAGIAETYQLMGKTGLQVKGKLDKRFLLVPVQRVETLLSEMEVAGTLTITVKDKIYHEVDLIPKAPLSFVLDQKNADVYQLTIHNPFIQYLSYYHWGFCEDGICELTLPQEEIYLALVQLMKRLDEPVISFERPQLPTLFQKVLPFLRQIGDVEVMPAVSNVIAEFPLHAVTTFRRRKGKIFAEWQFHYGETVFSSNPEKTVLAGKKEILRNSMLEEAVMAIFHTYGFTKVENGFEKPMPTGEQLYRFFRHELASFRKVSEVKIGKKLRQMYLDAQSHEPQMTVDESNSWLDIRFDVSGISEDEVDAVLSSLMRNEQYYTLESGEVLSLESEAFQQASAVINKFREILKLEKGVLHLPKSQGLQVQQYLSENSQISFSDNFTKMVSDLTHPENFKVPVPKNLHAELRPYQVTGFHWLKMLSHYGFGGILADEMGLGKTIQVITELLSEKEDNGTVKALIVAPASLIYNWQAEIKKFAPDLQTMVVSGPRDERVARLAKADEIIITSYASLRQDSDLHNALNYDYLILDEAQMVKNASTKTAKALRQLNIPHRFAVSGTPVENNLEELWSVFQIVMPGFFPSQGKFRALSTETVAQMIQPFVLRRDKQSVLKDLPEKIESNVLSSLTEEQKTLYLAYLRQMNQQISQMDSATFKKQRISILAGITRLRQICDDPRLFVDDYEGGSGKLEQLKDLILTAKENDRRILVFSQFTSMLSIIEAELAEQNIQTYYLRGSTKPEDRLSMVNEFNAGNRDVFLISLKAGGTGLNLTGADTVILYDLWWNPAVEEQAAGRAHRIGQKKVVEVWRMIAEGTIEERMNLLQQEKRELFQKVIQGSGEQLGQLTEDDIRNILSIGEELSEEL
jgi:superfamily II DNA or RNA helicase